MLRAALFVLVGVLFVIEFEVADSRGDVSETQADWTVVLLFSAALLALAVALPVFGQLSAGHPGLRASMLAAAGAGLSSAANIVEDGLLIEGAFFAFIAGAAILNLGLLVLTGVIVWRSRGVRRAHAVVSALTLVAITVYATAGGYLMLVAWLIAAGFAVAAPRVAPSVRLA